MIEIGVIFLLGYVLIALEHPLKIEKSATALLLGGLSWFVLTLHFPSDRIEGMLEHHLVEISAIAFFLLAAMTIVEVVESYEGFSWINKRIKISDKRVFFWIVGILTFFLSAILDNLATTIVMLTLAFRSVSEKEDRFLMTGIIVIAANSGGAFSPIGDITTTMLWIGGQVTFPNVTLALFIPSIVSFVVPTLILLRNLKGKLNLDSSSYLEKTNSISYLIFAVGVFFLVLIPVLKTTLHIPPYLSLLTGLGVLWIFTEIVRKGGGSYSENRPNLPSALKKIDLPSILFFIGILLAVGALSDSGALHTVSTILSRTIPDARWITILLGLFSAVFDNVPLVASAAKMFSLDQFPPDHALWIWLAFTTGTGGSILIIGSAAGIAAMGTSKVSFGWYLKCVAPAAFAGFMAGLGVLFLESLLTF